MRIRIYIYYLTLISFAIGSCHKKEDKYYPYYGTVKVTQSFAASNSNPNFATGDKVYFTAAFQQNVIWTITIKGQTSGAVKTITGSGTNLSSANSLWDGTANDVPVFRAESAVATLTFDGDTSKYSINLVIAGAKNLDAGTVLVSDFKNNLAPIYSPPAPGAPPPAGWISDWPTTVTNDTKYSYPDGNNYMFISGYPWNSGPPDYAAKSPINPYVDFLTIPAKYAQGNSYGTYFPIPPDSPNRIYFNILVCNTGTKYTKLSISINEDGGASFTINIVPDWPVGTWKLLSYNYASLSGGGGSPSKITSIQFTLLSTADQNTLDLFLKGASNAVSVSTAFDHPVFTIDNPWVP